VDFVVRVRTCSLLIDGIHTKAQMYLNFFNSLFIFLFFFSIFYISSAERRGKPKKGRLFVRPGHTTTTSIDKKKTKIEPRVKNKPIHDERKTK
jgi:hypothetical protein